MLLLVVYLAFYLLVGRAVAWSLGGWIGGDGLSTAGILVGIALPIVVGGAALAAFTIRLGRWSAVFGPQPIRGRAWMWVAPALVLAAVVAHLLGVDWGRWSPGQVGALVVVGVAVGFTEELATRGLVVDVLRRGGRGERYVAACSSALFALMHLSNLLAGMTVRTVAVTVVYTFGFGMCMYLTMRVTGTIWAAVALHGLTDPTTILSAGGVDAASGGAATGGAPVAVLLLTSALVLVGLVAVALVRGRASRSGRSEAGRGVV